MTGEKTEVEYTSIMLNINARKEPRMLPEGPTSPRMRVSGYNTSCGNSPGGAGDAGARFRLPDLVE